ncbi:unnamed protein product [Rotaria socialis]|uniref:Uncharacterized protein n=1 Tax=Rotaria socialis TaxID=392032 RepID=A0A817T6A9_9BILA|nr:unnamed protein product [Rotaria socialis]CAF4473452.1 unnamed protein product [Rotaria socialis]
MMGLIENLKKSKELNPGDIIIATNIAGRGIDLSVDKLLEANGGLHVILSYMPGNLRIQPIDKNILKSQLKNEVLQELALLDSAKHEKQNIFLL